MCLFSEDFSVCLWQTDAEKVQENRAGSRCLCWDQQRLHAAPFLARIVLLVGTACAYPYAETHILVTNVYPFLPIFPCWLSPQGIKRNKTAPSPHWIRKIEKWTDKKAGMYDTAAFERSHRCMSGSSFMRFNFHQTVADLL